MRSLNACPRRVSVLLLSALLLVGTSVCEASQDTQTDNVNPNGVTSAPLTDKGKTMQIEEVQVGQGPEAQSGDTVSVNYTGTLENGQKFDSSYDRNEPISFKLGAHQVIEGWEKGIAGMKVGGKRVLVIPPDQAYGPNGYPPVIPPNATLRFEVELVGVQ